MATFGVYAQVQVRDKDGLLVRYDWQHVASFFAPLDANIFAGEINGRVLTHRS